MTLELEDDVEVDIRVVGEASPVALIWFACHQGDESPEVDVARKLAGQGYQTFFPDMLSAHLLSSTRSNISRIPKTEVVSAIDFILKNSRSPRIYLIGGARAAVPVLKGLSDKRVQQAENRLKGALLITPRINKKNPQPGVEPVYVDAVGLSTQPIRILEGERTPNRWGLPHLKKHMAKSGSVVSSDLIKGVRGFFYLREEKTQQEQLMSEKLDQIIHQNLKLVGVEQ